MPLISYKYPVELNLLQCLGGICEEDRFQILVLSRVNRIKLRGNNSTNQTYTVDELFLDEPNDMHDSTTFRKTHLAVVWSDTVAAFLAKCLKISNPSDNMRYDPQIAPFFRASVFGLLILTSGVLVVTFSIGLQCIPFLYRCDQWHEGDTVLKHTILTLNMLGLSLVLCCPLSYVGITCWNIVFIGSGFYSLGFVLTSVLSLSAYIIDSYKEQIINMFFLKQEEEKTIVNDSSIHGIHTRSI